MNYGAQVFVPNAAAAANLRSTLTYAVDVVICCCYGHPATTTTARVSNVGLTYFRVFVD